MTAFYSESDATKVIILREDVDGNLVALENPASGEAGGGLNYNIHKFQPGVRTTRAFLVNGAGDNAVVTPAAGKRLRVLWVGMSASQDNAGENLVTVKFGAGPDIYRWRMGNPGAFSHWEPIEGGVDAPLVFNLANTQAIDVNLTWEEV